MAGERDFVVCPPFASRTLLADPPPTAVLAAFGIDGDPIPMSGGEGVSFRANDAVVKRVHDASEAEWCQQLLSRTTQDGFRLPDPLPTAEGRWVHEGWTASRYIAGLQPAAPEWAEIAQAGLRFADAAEQARDDGHAVLARRTHGWAIADRVAWGEQSVDLDAAASEVCDSISALFSSPRADQHLVHGDLSGNVHLDPDGVPVILDLSPYLRAREWAAAIVIADAVLWSDADPSLAGSFASGAAGRDLLARALTFRLVAEQLANDPRHGATLEPYRRLIRVLD